MNEGYFYHRYYNYAVALAGLVVILKEYMWKYYFSHAMVHQFILDNK
jgi:hypothetical protein